MKKFPLHWQILIALILAIIYGIVFPTKYVFTEKSIENLKKSKIPTEIIVDLEELEGHVFNTKAEFKNTIKYKLSKIKDPDKAKSYTAKITELAYFNPAANSVSWMGIIFLRALKMLILPLILSSIVSAVTNMGSGERLGRLGLKTMVYYISTSTIAILTGLALVNIVRPGIGVDIEGAEEVEGLLENQQGLSETLIQIIPTNIFEALGKADMLSIIFFSIMFGIFITRAKKNHSEFLQDFFNSVFDVMMKMTLFIIKFTPLGVFGIVVKVVADQDDLVSLAQSMGKYMGVVLAALFIHAFITLPFFVRVFGKARPFKHFANMSTPLLTAFSTSSSGATLPLTINAVKRESGVSNRISKFTLPLGATVNMDGTALYECVAAMFIAQAYSVSSPEFSLTFGDQMIIVITALLASIGAAAIPMAGLVMITVILSAVGLPLEGVGLILAVDRILDMFRTATNVWSDTCGAVIIAKSEGENLPIDIKPILKT